MSGLRVELNTTIGWDNGEIPGPEEISDLLVVLVDELDTLGIEPEVSSEVAESDLHVRIVAEFAFGDGPFEAMEHVLVMVKTAFHAAGIGTAAIDPTVVRKRRPQPVVRSLRHGELTTV